ncbi:hypothetical protein BGX29_007463 [Mortierella sp. GBA35]|nr:hypothetical protein BGX29_007463 [Mortierella sp. GBA35]
MAPTTYLCFFCETESFETRADLVKHFYGYHNYKYPSNATTTITAEEELQQASYSDVAMESANEAADAEHDDGDAEDPKTEDEGKTGNEGKTEDETEDMCKSGSEYFGSDMDNRMTDGDDSGVEGDADADSETDQEDEEVEKGKRKRKVRFTVARKSAKKDKLLDAIAYTICVVYADSPTKRIAEYIQEDDILFPKGSIIIDGFVKDKHGRRRAQPIAWVEGGEEFTEAQLTAYKILADHKFRINSPFMNAVCSTRGCKEKINWRTVGVLKRKLKGGRTSANLKSSSTCLQCRS